MTVPPPPTRRLFLRSSGPEAAWLGAVLRRETVGGALLLGATIAALLWANSPWRAAYFALRDVRVGPDALHLQLSLAQWAGDGLIAVFFFVAGLELKREFVAGDLRDPRRAALPVAAAAGGVLLPALLYLSLNLGPGGAPHGWAIPTATDVAFALAVLAVAGSRLPEGLRTFLLTLAVVDDLIAVTVIAVAYTAALSLGPLVLAALPLAGFTLAVQHRVRSAWLLAPLALAAWALVHASGVHPTVAGVLLGFAVPVRRRAPGEGPGLAEHFEHRFRPVSSAIAVPVFALATAGVSLAGTGGPGGLLADPAAWGVVVALVVGKPAGVLLAAWLTARFTRAELDAELNWGDVTAMAALTGVGFTVSLLIGELTFGAGTPRGQLVTLAVLVGSALSALVAVVLLRRRTRGRGRLL